MHKELKIALARKDYEKICQFLHTNHFPADSEWTSDRCNSSFVQGWRECEKMDNKRLARISELVRKGKIVTANLSPRERLELIRLLDGEFE